MFPEVLDRFSNRSRSGRYDFTVWHVATGQQLVVLRDCNDCAYFPDGKQLAVAHKDGTIEIWDIPPRRPLWIEYGLPVFFVLLLLLACWHCVQFRKKMAQAAGNPPAVE
jgi:hypothetical protein